MNTIEKIVGGLAVMVLVSFLSVAAKDKITEIKGKAETLEALRSKVATQEHQIDSLKAIYNHEVQLRRDDTVELRKSLRITRDALRDERKRKREAQ